MKKIVLILAVALSTNMMMAQSTSTVKEKVDAKMEQFNAPLGLSADQSAKVEAILTKRMTEIETLKANRPTREESVTRKADIKAINDAMKKEVGAVLTPEQRKKAEELKNNKKAQKVQMTK